MLNQGRSSVRMCREHYYLPEQPFFCDAEVVSTALFPLAFWVGLGNAPHVPNLTCKFLQVNFSTGQVSTLAGNGAKGSDYVGGRRGRNQQLNSPWDLAFDSQACLVH